MFISRLRVSNWKNFKSADVELKHRAFIVGPNASGKSNLLDVFRFLRDIVKLGGGLQEAVKLRDGVSKIRSLAARTHSDVEIEIEITNEEHIPIWRYSIAFNQEGGGIMDLRAILKRELVEYLPENKIIINRPNHDDQNDKKLLEYTNLEQPSANKAFRDVADFLQDIQYLHVIPQLLRDPQSFIKGNNREDYFGRDFLERMNKTNANKRIAYLKKIESALQFALPDIEGLKFIKDDMGVPHLEVVFRHWRAKGAKQRENQFSDGTLRFIGLFWALQDGNKTILLEEPELSLHSTIIRKLPEIIWKLQKKKSGRRQVILTTHSYDLLTNKGISADEILLLTPAKESTEVRLASSINEINILLKSGLSPADAVIPKTAPKNVDQLTLPF